MSQEKESIQDDKQHQIKEYRCFCSKNYHSYAGLYLHLKSKHQDAFSLYKNMKISKLLNPVLSDPTKVVFKLKEPAKEKDEKPKHHPEKIQYLHGTVLSQEQVRPLIRDQQYYVYRPQPPSYVPTGYHPSVPAQTYMIPGQPYYPAPVREFPVSSPQMIPNSTHPNTFYQYPVHMQPQHQPSAYSCQAQPMPTPYMNTNGIQYWNGPPPYAHIVVRERVVESQDQIVLSEKDFFKVETTSIDKTEKAKNKGEERKPKSRSRTSLSPEKDSLQIKIQNGTNNLGSERTKTCEQAEV